ncbi:hypothetical protein [Streptomyces sp. NPDC048392]
MAEPTRCEDVGRHLTEKVTALNARHDFGAGHGLLGGGCGT